MKKTTLALLSALVLWIPGLSAQELSLDQMREDLGIFRDALETFHPEMYRYTDQKRFSNLFDSLEAQLGSPLSQREFYKLLRPALVALKDGHVKWIVQGQDQHYGFFTEGLFPLQLYFQGESVKVLGHFGGESVPVLAEVKAINGQAIATLRQQLLSGLTYGDGESLGGKYFELNRYFSAFYSTEYGIADTYHVLLSQDGKEWEWKGAGVGKAQIEQAFAAEEEPFSFRLLNGWTGLLDINRFYTFKEEPDYGDFLKNSFESLQREGISNLILDLRGNEGGSEKYGIALYRYLAAGKFDYYDFLSTRPNQKVDFPHYTSKLFRLANNFHKKKDGVYRLSLAPDKTQKPYKNAFSGKVIVLLDGQSFSVTTEFASRAQSDGRAVFVGEETAGGAAVNSSGFFTILTLPNSKIDLGVPRLGFHMANVSPRIDQNRGIVPDVAVITTAEDMLSGRDAVMEQALQLVEKP
ncbi:peptidase S41 [Algoriphagus sp. H41]|uniref:Peptidase S41 n=1 Tax=Algoriphagus oliviformis TaxID=2811231 RepID=A0ABS3C5Y9_9BACT|nr:S41 family peptidase [Algoriphagus oliviformis]MBN7811979.1 peptidase S41 [Algoriphagus oliviformis]